MGARVDARRGVAPGPVGPARPLAAAADSKAACAPPRRAILTAVLSFVGLFGFASLGVSYLYHRAKVELLEALRTEVAQLARAAVPLVDIDLHQQLRSPEQTGSAEHLQAIRPLADFHRALEDVYYVYTAVLLGGEIHFVLGTDHLYRVSGDDELPDPVMGRYPGSDSWFMQALREQRLVVQPAPVQEAKRAYLSAFAPLHDRQGGFIGVVGVDMDAASLNRRLVDMRHTYWSAEASLLLLALLAAGIVGRISLRHARAEAAEHAALLRAEAEAASANQFALEASAASRAKSEFLAMMSHEIRTPLHGIVATLDLLSASSRDPAQQRYLRIIDASSQTLLRQINDLLDFSRAESGRISLEMAPFDLARAVTDVVGRYTAAAERRGLDLQLDIPDEARIKVLGDRVRVDQVLSNLMSNALKFTEQGSVAMELQVEGDHRWHFAIRDTGPGIPAGEIDRLFQPFAQLDGSNRREHGGSGLGLAICQRLVGLMGGRLWVSSELGQGTTVHVVLTLPVAPVAKQARAADSAEPTPSP